MTDFLERRLSKYLQNMDNLQTKMLMRKNLEIERGLRNLVRFRLLFGRMPFDEVKRTDTE